MIGAAEDCVLMSARDTPGDVVVLNVSEGSGSGVIVVLSKILEKLGGKYSVKKVLGMDGSSSRLCFHVELGTVDDDKDDDKEDSKPAATSKASSPIANTRRVTRGSTRKNREMETDVDRTAKKARIGNADAPLG